MKPVFQTRHGWPDGNCLMASLASIFAVTLEECPDLGPANVEYGPDYWKEIQGFARARGMEPVWIERERTVAAPPAGYAIVSVMQPNGIPHACVSLDGRIVHNPVAGAPLDFPATVRGYIAFVPLRSDAPGGPTPEATE